jgi:hypothetical protein
MPSINFPTQDIKYFHQTNVFLRGDQDSIDQYAIDKGISGVTNIVLEDQRFSNNGAITYQYFMTSGATWVTEYGFDRVVVSLDHD